MKTANKKTSSNSLVEYEKKQIQSGIRLKERCSSLKEKSSAISISTSELRRENKITLSSCFKPQNHNIATNSISYTNNSNNTNETPSHYRKKSVNIFKNNFKSCNKNLPSVKTRKDSNGNLIKKGSKNPYNV